MEISRRQFITGAAAGAVAEAFAAAPSVAVAPKRPWCPPYQLGDHPTAAQWEENEDRNAPWAWRSAND